MPASTVRIDAETNQILRELAARDGESMGAVLRRAIKAYRRKRFLDDLNRGYAALRRNPKAWKEELDERRAWDSALADGLEGDGPPV